jgi:hypothetical protein
MHFLAITKAGLIQFEIFKTASHCSTAMASPAPSHGAFGAGQEAKSEEVLILSLHHTI